VNRRAGENEGIDVGTDKVGVAVVTGHLPEVEKIEETAVD
jgi:hypothetical protein